MSNDSSLGMSKAEVLTEVRRIARGLKMRQTSIPYESKKRIKVFLFRAGLPFAAWLDEGWEWDRESELGCSIEGVYKGDRYPNEIGDAVQEICEILRMASEDTPDMTKLALLVSRLPELCDFLDGVDAEHACHDVGLSDSVAIPKHAEQSGVESNSVDEILAETLTKPQWLVIGHLRRTTNSVRFSTLKAIPGAFRRGEETQDRAVESLFERTSSPLADAGLEVKTKTTGDSERWARLVKVQARN